MRWVSGGSLHRSTDGVPSRAEQTLHMLVLWSVRSHLLVSASWPPNVQFRGIEEKSNGYTLNGCEPHPSLSLNDKGYIIIMH